MVFHGAGWLKGGLIASYEKFIIDCEMIQQLQDTLILILLEQVKSNLLLLPYGRLVITDTFLEQLIPKKDIKMYFTHHFCQTGVTMRLGKRTGK